MPSLATIVLIAAVGLLGSNEGQKRAQRRAEADRVILQLTRGGGGVEAATARIRYLGEEAHASGVLIRALHETHEDAGRRNIAHALSILAARSAERTLLQLADDGDAVVRMYALQGLTRLKTKHTETLLGRLSDPSMPVRREAARALGQARQPKSARALLAAARVEGEPEARAAMLVAVGESGDKKASKALEAFLADSSETTRIAAARGLCLLGAKAGFDFARGLLSSEDRFERRAGVALFEGGSAKAVGTQLRPLLEDPDRRLAATAARILYQGGDKKMVEWLVLASHQATGQAKLDVEVELEKLHLADAERRAILKRNGVP